MKQILTLVGSLVLLNGLMAQQTGMNRARKGFDAPSSVARTGNIPNDLVQDRGACILTEDFESTALGALPAGWTTGNVEQQEDDNAGALLGTFVPGFIVNTLTAIAALPGTNYFTIPDAPAENKFAAANDDGDPCNCAMPLVSLASPTLDFSGLADMSVGFRVFCDDSFGGQLGSLDVSTDDGATWVQAIEIESVETTWQNLVVDLSAYDGSSNVKLRFTWNDGGNWAVGMAIDDVCVAPILPNNLSLVLASNSDQTRSIADETVRSFEYTRLPAEQATPVDFSARFRNNGGVAQTAVIVTASLSFNGGTPTQYVSNPIASLAPGVAESVAWSSDFTPPGPGTVAVTFTLSASAADENPSDNTLSKSFVITGPASADGSNVMARDQNSAGSFFGPVDGTAYRLGNVFEITEPNSIAYGIGVCVGNASAGTLLQGEILAGDFSVIELTEEYIITDLDQNDAGGNYFTYMPLASPVTLDELTDVVAVVHHFGGEQVRIAASGVPEDTTAFFQDDSNVWSWVGATPMVRLFLGNLVGIEESNENGSVLGANMPNPFNGFTSIPFSLKEARTVSFQIIDMTGKTVFVRDMGMRAAGNHLMEFDSAGLAAGVYSYTMTAGSTRLTRRMLVK